MKHDVYLSGQVTRYHCNPRVPGQTNADHQWGVVALIMSLHPNPSKELLRAATFHDSGELKAGDIPRPVKWANPEHAAAHDELESQMREQMGIAPFELEGEEADWLALADILESFLFMQLHGQVGQWSTAARDRIGALATRLGVFSQVKELCNG